VSQDDNVYPLLNERPIALLIFIIEPDRFGDAVQPAESAGVPVECDNELLREDLEKIQGYQDGKKIEKGPIILEITHEFRGFPALDDQRTVDQTEKRPDEINACEEQAQSQKGFSFFTL
jgi:hypothetical protein